MRLWPKPLPDCDPGFDEALRKQMAEHARKQSAAMLAGNFFTNAVILEELEGESKDDEGDWNFRFGGQSWAQRSTASIVVPDTGVYGDADTSSPGDPTKYELFLESRCRSPYLRGKTDKRLRSVVQLFKRHLIKTCTYIAVDTTYRYQVNSSKPTRIQRSAQWSIVGIRPDRPGDGDVVLKSKEFKPIKNPSPLGSYYVFGPQMEFASAPLSLSDHRKQERNYAIYFDKLRVNKMLGGLVWAAIDAEY